MSVCIVTHCYSDPYPLYAAMLRYQLSSLVHHKPETDVVVSVCYHQDDAVTTAVINDFPDLVRHYPLSKEALFRRCIGRDIAARDCRESVVWFADADYCFGAGALDFLDQNFPSDAVLVYPPNVISTETHEQGDEIAKRALDEKMPDINPEDFTRSWSFNRAVGGCQIVRGDFARQHGYLGGTKWHTFIPDVMMPDTKDDIAYRKFCLNYGSMTPLDIPQVYRIRHTFKMH